MIDFPNPAIGLVVTVGRKKWQCIGLDAGGKGIWDLLSTPDQAAIDAAASAAAAAHVYAGAYAAAPLTRPDGSARVVGDVYFNSTSNLNFRWNGATWAASDISTANLAAATGSSLVGHVGPGASEVARPVQDRLRDLRSCFDWFTSVQIAAWRAADTTLDVTGAIATALAESPYGVWMPDGAGLITSLTVPTGKAFVGMGSRRVTLKQKAATAGTAVIVNSTSQACTVGGFQIDGNKAAQAAANKGFELASVGAPPGGGTHFPGGNHRFDDIYAVNCKGTGIYIDGPGGVNSIGRLQTFQCDGDGVYIGVQDSMIEEIDSGASGGHGVVFGAGGYNNRISKLKAWFSGQLDSVNSGDGIFCQGWYNQIGVTELQDIGRHGVNFNAASNNIFPAVHVESCGRVNASSYGVVFTDSRSNLIATQQTNRTANAGYLGCVHFANGGAGAFYNDVTINKGTAALVDTVFDDAIFHPARNYVRVNNITNDDGPRIASNLNLLYKVNIVGPNAKLVFDNGGSVTANKWSVAANGNDSVTEGFSNSRIVYFSGSHGATPGYMTVFFGDGVAGAKWRLQNYNGATFQTIIEAAEAGGVRQLGFFGAGAVAKPAVAGSRGANAALASLLTALANLGLVTDGTTA